MEVRGDRWFSSVQQRINGDSRRSPTLGHQNLITGNARFRNPVCMACLLIIVALGCGDT
jgi:hypothetical protein